MAKKKHNGRLQERDYEILEHVNLYRMTTREVLHQYFFELAEPNAVTKVTSRLCDDGYLERYPLVGPSSYFSLGKRGAKLFGVPTKRVGPLGPQARYMHYAILGFCCFSERKRRRLSISEIRKSFPDLLIKRMDSSSYVLDEAGKEKRLLFLSIDGGATADYITRKTKDCVTERAAVPFFAAIMELNRFAVACVTYHDEKARVLQERFSKETLPCEITVETVRGLQELQNSDA